MAAGTWDIEIEQGATFARTLDVKKNSVLLDLSGWDARMQVRPDAASSTVLLSLVVGSGLTLNGGAGQIVIEISAAQTAALAFELAHHDLEIVDGGGQVVRLLQGKVTLSKEITR